MEVNIEELKNKKREIEEDIKKLEKEKKQQKKNNRNLSNIEIRVSHDFKKELEDIDNRRDDLGMDKISNPKKTGLFVKHKRFWNKLKEDVINYDTKNNKGQLSVFVFIVIVGSFFAALLLFASGVTVMKIDQALDVNISLGQVNLQEINDQTFGIYADTFVNNADWWGLATIFGMILGLIISAYLVRNRFPKLGIILDIFFIFVAFIFSLYISSTYQIILDAFQSAGEPFLEVYTPRTSFFILNLPIFVPIIGVIMMVLFHSSIPPKNDERFQKGGLLQGVQ